MRTEQDIRLAIDSESNEPPIFPASNPEMIIRDSVFLTVMYLTQKLNNRIDIAPSPSVATLVGWVVLDDVIGHRFIIDIPQKFVNTFQYFKDHKIPQMILSSSVNALGHEALRYLSLTSIRNISDYFCYFEHPCDKKDPETFKFLAAQLFKLDQNGVPPSKLLLVTFNETEALMAARAGFQVAKVRQCNQPPAGHPSIQLINDISEIRLDEAPTD